MLGAGVAVIVQVMLEAVGPHQWRGRHAQLYVAQLAEQFAGRFELFAGALKATQAQGDAMFAQWADRSGFGHLDAFAIRQHCDKSQVRRTQGLANLDLELGGAFLARLQGQGAALVALYLQAIAGLQFKLHLCRRVEVAEHPGADVEHIPRRHKGRHVGRDHDRAAHVGIGFADAHAVTVHRHRKQVQLAVEAVRHLVMQYGFASGQVDQSRPPSHRRLVFTLERVEVIGQGAFRIATGRCPTEQTAEFRQDQVKDLTGADLQRSLLEEEAQRIRRLVARHLQDAFVHRVHHRATWAVGVDLDVEHLPRLDLRRAFNLQRHAPRIQVDAEGHHAIGQRAHVHLGRAHVAHKLHVDVGIAFKPCRHADMLHAVGAVGLEPLLGVDLVPLDGDQAGTGIRRADADRNFITGGVAAFIQAQLQLGIAFQRARGVASSGHAVVDLVEQVAVGVFQLQGEVTRCAGVQGLLGAFLGHHQR